MSIAALITEALNEVSASEVGEAVQDAVIIRGGSQGAYDPATGTYASTPSETITGRAAFAQVKATDILPEGTGGPGDMVLYLFEATGKPREGETITCTGRDYSIASTPADEIGIGGLVYKMIVRRT